MPTSTSTRSRIAPDHLAPLTQALDLSLTTTPLKKDAPRRGAVAYSRSGAHYPAGAVRSQTHVLDIEPELAALVRAAHHRDVAITEVHGIASDDESGPSPLALTALMEHALRTNIPLRYRFFDVRGRERFTLEDVRSALHSHRPSATPLPAFLERTPEAPSAVEPDTDTARVLRRACKDAFTRNFPTREGASGYVAAVRTASGRVYCGGQYSSFGGRLGVHAEVAVLMNALMDGARDITDLAVMSSKFPDTPCAPCGCCRQFIAELAQTYQLTPTIWLFAAAQPVHAVYTIENLLPAVWTNQR